MGVRKRNNKWWIDFCFNRTRYRQPSPENSRAGALAWELVLKQRLARGGPLDPAKDRTTTFKEFAQDWFETYVKNNNKHSEIETKKIILRVHLVPYFGRMKIDEIGNLDIEKYKAQKIGDGLSAKSINNHLTVLRKALRCALEWEVVKNCPIIKTLTVPPPQYDFLTADECRRLHDAADSVWRDMIVVALGTGLRFGELIALSWEDIDFTNRELIIKQAYARGVLGTTKSNRIRHIPMTDSTFKVFRGMRNRKGLVFSGYGGSPLRLNNSLHRLHLLCVKAGLRKIGWHTLRHTFASQLAQGGANLVAVQGLLGHSDIRTTMRYAHINRAVLRKAIGILEKPADESQDSCHNSVTGKPLQILIDKMREAELR